MNGIASRYNLPKWVDYRLLWAIVAFAGGLLLLFASHRPVAAGSSNYTLIINKQAWQPNGLDPHPGPWSFDFTCTSTYINCNTFTLTNLAPSHTFNNMVYYDTVTITETVSPGWTASVSCKNQHNVQITSGTNSITLTSAIVNYFDTITCTFSNIAAPPPPALTIAKVVDGTGAPADWSFPFTGDLGSFSLTDDAPSTTDSDVTPGTVAVNETNPAGYATSVACDNSVSATGGNLSLTMVAGDDVSCTFTNTICQPGSFDTTTTWACALADPGFYVDTTGASGQTACPPGTTSPAGSDSISDCVGTAPDIFMSTTLPGTTADGLAFGMEDIIEWDGVAWSMWFDGSDAGLAPVGKWKHNINAFWIPDPNGDEVIMSFTQNRRLVPDIVDLVNGMDLVRWDGSAFSLWFDGEDVGLTQMTQEKIDSLHVLPGSASPIGGGCLNYLLISTQGPGRVTGYNGTSLRFRGEDVLGFCLTNAGNNTAGFWHMALDGSAVGMPPNATDSISLSDDGRTMYLTTKKAFNVPPASGNHSMVYAYDMSSGTFSGPLFIAANHGLPKKVDGLQMQ